MTKLGTLLHLTLFGLVLYPFTIAKAQVSAASCNSSDVQSAIDRAAEGQTVSIPAGSCTWTAGVKISGKGITLHGAGAGRIIAYSPSALSIGVGSKTMAVTSTLVSGSLSISPGETLTISETGNRQNYMTGTVSSYSSGSLTMNITSSGGSCGNSSDSNYSISNCKRWLISTIPSTVIVNNAGSSVHLFDVTEDSTVHTNLSGFKIAYGGGAATGVVFNAGGGAAIVLHDCWIEVGVNTANAAIQTYVNRGVVSNCSVDATPFSMAPIGVHLQPYSTSSWSSASNWGTSDTDGQHNFYVETSDLHAFVNSTDNDEGARSVFRYNLFDNAEFSTHGADTSPISQRYFEFYNNIGVFNSYTDSSSFNMSEWFEVRGGSYVIHDNTLAPISSSRWGNKADVMMIVQNLQRNAGPNACWGAGTSGGSYYHAPQQVGMGYVTGTGHAGNGSSTYDATAEGYGHPYVGDPEPAYIWNNNRSFTILISDYGLGNSGSCSGSNYDISANYIKSNRDYFSGSTAKPGYTPYTYPHPLVAGEAGGGQQVPPPPIGLTGIVN
jgi:hypothetical protein